MFFCSLLYPNIHFSASSYLLNEKHLRIKSRIIFNNIKALHDLPLIYFLTFLLLPFSPPSTFSTPISHISYPYICYNKEYKKELPASGALYLLFTLPRRLPIFKLPFYPQTGLPAPSSQVGSLITIAQLISTMHSPSPH